MSENAWLITLKLSVKGFIDDTGVSFSISSTFSLSSPALKNVTEAVVHLCLQSHLDEMLVSVKFVLIAFFEWRI